MQYTIGINMSLVDEKRITRYSRDEIKAMFLLMNMLKVTRYTNAYEFRDFLARIFYFKKSIAQNAMLYFDSEELVELKLKGEYFSFGLVDFLNFIGLSTDSSPYNSKFLEPSTYDWTLSVGNIKHQLPEQLFEKLLGLEPNSFQMNDFVQGVKVCDGQLTGMEKMEIEKFVDFLMTQIPDDYFEAFREANVELLSKYDTYYNPSKVVTVDLKKHIGLKNFIEIFEEMHEMPPLVAKGVINDAINDSKILKWNDCFEEEQVLISLGYLAKNKLIDLDSDVFELKNYPPLYFDMNWDHLEDIALTNDKLQIGQILELYNYAKWEHLIPINLS